MSDIRWWPEAYRDDEGRERWCVVEESEFRPSPKTVAEGFATHEHACGWIMGRVERRFGKARPT